MVVLMGTSSINGPFSMAMLNNQRVYLHIKNKHWIQLESNITTDAGSATPERSMGRADSSINKRCITWIGQEKTRLPKISIGKSLSKE